MTRILPGVHSSLNDLSTLPEGARSLTVGYVLKANRGPIGKCELVTSPTDFLTKYTFSGKPLPTDDYTFHSILGNLAYTNQMYISRAAKNALYGGLVVKKETLIGNIVAIAKTAKTISITGDVTASIAATDVIRVKDVNTTLNGRYTVVSSSFVTPNTVVVVSETVAADYTYTTGTVPTALKTVQPKSLTTVSIGAITAVSTSLKKFTVAADKTDYALATDKIQVKGSTGNDETYTIVSSTFVDGGTGNPGTTEIIVSETVSNSTADGTIYRDSIANPEGYAFASDDLFLVSGIDQGAYNANLEIAIVSSTESPDSLTEANIFTLSVYDATTNTLLETFTVSRQATAKSIDGSALYIEDVINGSSAYIQVIDNTAIVDTALPCNTTANSRLSGGFDGDTLVEADMVSALEYFADKTIPISILGNGSTEGSVFQQAMIALAESRKDIFCFLNSRLSDEKATLNSVKAQNIVAYKKNTLGSTSFYGCMYACHNKVADIFNSRNVTIGADSAAISGWLNIINTKGYPYAYAGPTDGLVTKATCDWKIGDESGEATLLNDASVNFIAFDPKQGRYYMQTQNTLQVAKSAMRNIGTVLNILDIKETFVTYFKEYLQRPITKSLRGQILDRGTDIMNLVKDQGRVSDYAFQDTSTDLDVSSDTLRYLLTLAPTSYAQNIYLVMNIVNQTFDFAILQSI